MRLIAPWYLCACEQNGRAEAGAARTPKAQEEDRKAAAAEKRADQSDKEDAEGASSQVSAPQQDHQQQGSTTDAQVSTRHVHFHMMLHTCDSVLFLQIH